MHVKSLRDYTIKKEINETSPFTGPKFPFAESMLRERDFTIFKEACNLYVYFFSTPEILSHGQNVLLSTT